MTHESFLISSRVFVLSFNKALPPQVFMTFLAGHPIFNSNQEKKNFQFSVFNFQFMEYFSCISVKHLINISSFAQNIWAITGVCSLLVSRCFTTPRGLMTYPSAFINSVRSCKSYFSFSPYCSKISFVIWRKAQSVNQSIGAKPMIIINVELKIFLYRTREFRSKNYCKEKEK